MNRFKRFLVGGTGALCVALGGYAQAQIGLPELFDEKTIPASACATKYPNQQGSVIRGDSYIYNSSSGSVSVVCPLVRDNSVNANGTWSVAITGKNSGLGGALICRLNSFNDRGEIKASDTVNTTNKGYFTLNLDVNMSPPDGFYAITCNLTSGSRLFSYRWAEPLRTDRNN